MSDGGKGSAPRPYSVDRKTFEENWNAIFGDDNLRVRDVDSGGVQLGQEGGDCGGAQHSTEHKPSE